MQNQSQMQIGFLNFVNSDKNSDILSFHPSLSLADGDCFNKKQKINEIQENQVSVEESVTSQYAQLYFNLLFSPKVVTQYLVRRNQYLQIKCLENFDSEPQQIYHKRKKRVQNLQQKQKKNWDILINIKKKQPEKYRAIKNFTKLLGDVKLRLNGIRHDYYSQKTFSTLKKASSSQISQVTKILSQILISVFSSPKKITYNKQDHEIDYRYIEFLIIPRFFISKQKLIRFIKDSSIQQNFKFLICHGCLGHYNNEANKKLPEQKQMSFVRVLLQEQDGRQRFKRICSINHGGKFIKQFKDLYFELYSKSLQCLKNIDQICKKQCTEKQIKEQLQKQHKRITKKSQNSIISYLINQNLQNSISCNLPNLTQNNLLAPQNPLDFDHKLTSMSSTVVKNHAIPHLTKQTHLSGKSKCNVRRICSFEEYRIRNRPENIMSKLRRSNTFDTNQVESKAVESNIIIIAPPNSQAVESNLDV